MSDHEIDEQDDVPDWVKRLRAAGHKVTVGTGGPLSYEPEVDFFTPPFPLRSRTSLRMERIGRGFRSVLAKIHHLVRRRGHAALP